MEARLDIPPCSIRDVAALERDPAADAAPEDLVLKDEPKRAKPKSKRQPPKRKGRPR